MFVENKNNSGQFQNTRDVQIFHMKIILRLTLIYENIMSTNICLRDDIRIDDILCLN